MISPGQVSVGTAPTVLGTVPPGPASVVITNGGTATVFVGAGTTASVLTGTPVPAGAVVPLGQFSSSSSTKLWGITAGATAVSTGLIISTGS